MKRGAHLIWLAAVVLAFVVGRGSLDPSESTETKPTGTRKVHLSALDLDSANRELVYCVRR